MKVPETPPSMSALLASVEPNRLGHLFALNLGPAPEGKYRHWETVKRITPPENLTVHELWLAMKFARQSMRRDIPTMLDKEGRPFWYSLPDPLLEMQHAVDKKAGGRLLVDSGTRYVQQSLIEEAITSSQLEGAATTRRVAKEMIRSGREPRNVSEQMILNNYRAMLEIRDLSSEPLTVQLIEEIHSILVADTAADKIGYRKEGDGTRVYDNVTDHVLFVPPPASESRDRLEALCEFANTETGARFLHPAVKAIVLHFWFAYIHPFEDGNGRTARALFYWFMLRADFWLIQFMSISRILKRAPARYGMSFLYTETDDNDLTYFILSQLRVMLRSIEDLESYLAKKAEEVASVSRLLRSGSGLNHRQIALLSHALRHPNQAYTFKTHKNSHRVTYQTARTDLLGLEDSGLLIKEEQGRQFVFRPVRDMEEKLRSFQDGQRRD